MSDQSRTIHPGQFRLVRLQIVNWGTFGGYKDFPISHLGTLFTGPSGSGKSSLMDAHSAVLLPAHDQRFNASADLTARGAKQATRSVADYVRGAWSETNDEYEQSQVRYLRGGKPTWSAIGATYDNGIGTAVTAVTVKWFTGVENDGSSMRNLYAICDGSFTLTALQGWAEREFDLRWLKANHPMSYPVSQEAYLRDLTARIGLGGSKSALSLLGKAKAMKNVGDLNLFIRDNMLDRPDTFGAAERMVNTFTPLNDAFETAHRAFLQAKELRDVPQSWERFQQASQTRVQAESLLEGPCDIYLRGVHLKALGEEIRQIDELVLELDRQLAEKQQVRQRAYDTFRSLDAQWQQQGTALLRLQDQLATASTETTARRDAYRSYSGYVGRLGLTCPQNEHDFDLLRQRLPAIENESQTEQLELRPQLQTAYGKAENARNEHQAKKRELERLQSAKSLIPSREVQRREAIARATGVPVADLPYAAELIDIADGQERWRPAAEKMLRGYGLRLLVPERHQHAIKQFIDTNDMRGVVEYSIITASPTQRIRARPDTLAGKLTVDADHPASTWLAGQLATRFDHVCVETARDMDPHRTAVTVNGTVKLPGNHYRKDDRPELTNPSSYILGANTIAKRVALQAEVDELEKEKKRTADIAAAMHERDAILTSIIDSARQLSHHTSWAKLDFWASTRLENDLKERINAILDGDVDLRQLEQQRDRAEQEWERLTREWSQIGNKISDATKRQGGLVDLQELEERKPHSITDDSDRAYLDEVLDSLATPVTPDSISQVRTSFRKELTHRINSATEIRQSSLATVKRAIDKFIEQWPDTAPDTSGDAERSGGDFAALHNEISGRRLPDAMTRFQQMISEDMVPSIGMLQRAIEKATQEIQERIEMVNAGLGRVEFNAGTHLQIACNANLPAEVKMFRGKVDELLRHAPKAQRDSSQAVTQFRRVRELMALFTADTTEGRRWRASVLDVRNSYTFYGCEKGSDGTTIHTYRNTAANSGGEQEKLVAFCLAAALSYNLADSESEGRPRFAPLMLDEAFSKSDETFAAQALSVFEEFGFQLLIAAPIRMSGIVEPFIGQAILVEKRVTADGAHSNAATATFGELIARRVAEIDGPADARAR